MAAVRFVTELLPALEAIDGVVVEQIGTVPEYRESDAAPVVSLGGAESEDNDWFDLDHHGDRGRGGGPLRRAVRGPGRGAVPPDPAVGDLLLPRPATSCASWPS